MKSYSSIVFSLLSVSMSRTVLAGWSKIQALASKPNKQFNYSISKIFEAKHNRGCWCYFDQTHGQGRGQPVDRIDEICKQLHQNYECLLIDSQSLDLLNTDYYQTGTLDKQIIRNYKKNKLKNCKPWEITFESIQSNWTGSIFFLFEESI